MKIKANQKREKYLDITRELKKLCIVKMTVIPVLIGALGIVPKGLEKGFEVFELEGRIETI